MKVAQSCPTVCNPMDHSLPSSSVYGILQARIREWVAVPFSRGSSQPRDWSQISCIANGFFTLWDTREAPKCSSKYLISPIYNIPYSDGCFLFHPFPCLFILTYYCYENAPFNPPKWLYNITFSFKKFLDWSFSRSDLWTQKKLLQGNPSLVFPLSC